MLNWIRLKKIGRLYRENDAQCFTSYMRNMEKILDRSFRIVNECCLKFASLLQS